MNNISPTPLNLRTLKQWCEDAEYIQSQGGFPVALDITTVRQLIECAEELEELKEKS